MTSSYRRTVEQHMTGSAAKKAADKWGFSKHEPQTSNRAAWPNNLKIFIAWLNTEYVSSVSLLLE